MSALDGAKGNLGLQHYLEWRHRPCSRDWTLRERPCRWFRFGWDCDRSWHELVGPTNLIAVLIMEINVLLALCCCCYLLRWSRKNRVEKPETTPHAKVVRRTALSRRGTFGVAPRPGDFLSWKTYNDYERCCIWVGLACLMELVAFLDPEGSARLMAWYVRGFNHGLIRWFFDLSLFQMTSAYRTTLTGVRDRGFLVAGSITFIFQAITNWFEGYHTPRRGRVGGACWNNNWNFVRNFGAGLMETVAILASVRFALNVRSRFRRDLSRTNYARNQRVVRGIVIRIMMVGGITFVALIFGVFVGIRNQGTYTCSQPTCTVPEYLWGTLWAIAYVAVSWYTTIFLGAGRPVETKAKSSSLFARPAAVIRPPNGPVPFDDGESLRGSESTMNSTLSRPTASTTEIASNSPLSPLPDDVEQPPSDGGFMLQKLIDDKNPNNKISLSTVETSCSFKITPDDSSEDDISRLDPDDIDLPLDSSTTFTRG